MIIRIEKNKNSKRIFLFNAPIYYSNIENGIYTRRFLCFRKKEILPEFFIEERKNIEYIKNSILLSNISSKTNNIPTRKENSDINVNKKISVIIPLFNNESLIKRCLSSILNQSYRDLEVIVIDDHSTDKSYSIVEEIGKLDKRIIIHKNIENAGSGKSRNYALSIATGAYITFCDSDDYFSYKNFFADCMRELRNKKVDCVITPYLRERNNKFTQDKFPESTVTNGKDAASLYLSRKLGTHAPCGKFFKRESIGESLFDEYGFSQDVPFISSVLIRCKKVSLYKKYGYVYFNDNFSAWRPQKLSDLHFYSSVRLLFNILNFQKYHENKNCYINIVAFIRLWKKEHGERIINYFSKNEFESINFVKSIEKIVHKTLDEYSDFDEITTLIPNSDDAHEELISEKEKQYIENLNKEAQTFKRLHDRQSVAIYISHLSNGGLERVASELSFILRDLGFEVNFILDNTKNVAYKYYGKILKADINNVAVKNILRQAKYIFDFKFKVLDREFPIVEFIIENYSEKFIPTIHNTETCNCYFEKTKEYLTKFNKTNNDLKCILCVSDAVKDKFRSLYGDSSNLLTLHNFVDLNKTTILSKEKGIDIEGEYYLFAGRLSQIEQKGLDILINGFIQANLNKNRRLVLCGAGELDSSLKKIIDRSDKKDRILVLPFMNNIFPVMKNAKALLAPSRWEGFSMVHLEALSVGIPVLSSKCGGALEILVPYTNGLLCEVDSVESFTNSLEQIDRMSFDKKTIINSVRPFSKESYSIKLNNILSH